MESVMKLQHFSHHHLLMLKDDCTDVVCSGCEETITDPCYSCASCNFFLHRNCAELSREIRHPLHPEHPLLLLAKPPPSRKIICNCDMCFEICNSFVYNCSLCELDFHIKCVALPHKIKRHWHPQHPLLLLLKSNRRGYICSLCKNTCHSWVYGCSLCDFVVDMKCGFLPCLSEVGSHKHQFISLLPSLPLKSFSFTCNSCGSEGDRSPFLCTICQLVVHEKCISLPRSIRTDLHHHPIIVHTYVLGQDGSVKQHCGICREEVKAGFGGYYCPCCEFVAHVSCAQQFGMAESEDKPAGPETKQEEKLDTAINDEHMESAFTIVREIEQEKDIVIAEIKHFSHPHNLILIEEVKHGLKCDGCMLPISSSYYSCAECDFFLDRSCCQLPKQKKLLYDPHPLTLMSEASTYDGVFVCGACKQCSNGFFYRCELCDNSIDVRCCTSMKTSIEHEGHKHPLYWAMRTENYHCNACGGIGNSQLFRCTDCGFNLDIRCANLPHKASHKYDDHPLLLTYTDPNTYQFYCLICEKERDRNLWFYRCEECDFDAHSHCVLGEYPYIKFGVTFMSIIHSHPVVLIKDLEGNPACHACGDACNDLAIKCTDSQCGFIIHRKPRCIDLSMWPGWS